TSETVMAVRKMRERGSDTLAISCYESTPLSAASHMTVAVRQGQEKSYAQTRSFAGMLVAVQAMAAVVSEDETLMNELCLLPEVGQHLIRRSGPMAKSYCKERYKRITYLGSFALYGLAGEAMIKMKEMSLSTAEAFHFMEFRHGPIALVDDEHLIVGLLSDSAREYELGVLRDLRARGGHTLAMGQDVDPLLGEVGSVFDLYAPKVSERARAVLYLPLLQLLAYYRAMARELDPDRPRNVEMAIRLDGTKMAAS
ncbi:MAG TPA: SIS domain-containing protein, partial [Chloroflexi bacterium]|nr:SIS domain-containing protein [Chloroflexota bacterium]